jgi:Type IV secretion system pilin
MRTFIIAALFVLFASFGAPTVVFALTAVGGTCFASTDCTSGYCDGATETCQMNPIQTSVTNTGTILINPLKSGTSLESFLGNILDFVIRIGTIIVILMLVFVGFKFVTAQGSETKLVEARKMLLWTIIGALVLLGSVAIKDSILATVQALGG